jgi:uncharacterized protein
MEEAVIIFVKNLLLGTVKTRLARKIGNSNALIIYEILLKFTQSITKSLSMDKIVYYSDNIDENDIWNELIYQKKIQKGATIGERMNNAISTELRNYRRVVLIGSDCYELSSQILQQAFSSLNSHDVCIGPAKDGGYYLIGLKYPQTSLFQNKKWSSNEVFKTTLADIESLNMTYHLLPQLNDIDEYDDLKHYDLINLIDLKRNEDK